MIRREIPGSFIILIYLVFFFNPRGALGEISERRWWVQDHDQHLQPFELQMINLKAREYLHTGGALDPQSVADVLPRVTYEAFGTCRPRITKQHYLCPVRWDERVFYHSSDPCNFTAAVVGGSTPAVELHWTLDQRYIDPCPSSETECLPNAVCLDYTVLRRTIEGVSPNNETLLRGTVTTWTDLSVVVGETYEYRLKSRLESGDAWFDMSSINLTIPPTAPAVPYGWLESVTSSEDWWQGGGVVVRPADVAFRFAGPVDAVRIKYRYGTHGPTFDYPFPTVPADGLAALEVAQPDQGAIYSQGGLAFRLVLTYAGHDYYFPGDDEWVFTSLNNRLLNPFYGEYLPNPASYTWRAQIAQEAVAIVSGVNSPYGEIQFDGVHGDNAFTSIGTANAPMVPADYQGDEAYRQDMKQLIQTVRTALDADGTNPHDFLSVNSVYSDYHLPGPHYASGLDGIMIESRAACGTGWFQLATHVQRSVQDVVAEGFTVIYSSAETMYDVDDVWDQLRLYELATYFLVRDDFVSGDQGRLAFGIPFRAAAGAGLNLYPEATLYLGEPLHSLVYDENLDNPPADPPDRDECPDDFPLQTRVFERGLVVLDPGNTDKVVNFHEIYGALQIPCPEFLYRLEIPQWDQIPEGGFVSTYRVSTDPSQSFTLPANWAAIFLTEDAATPRAPVAMALLTGKADAKLAIRPIDGGTLTTCRIYDETLTQDQWLILFDDGTHGDDVADDNLYTNTINTTSIAAGQTCQLHWYAENEGGLVGLGEIDVPVIEPLATAYGDKSLETQDLAAASFQGEVTSSLAFDADNDIGHRLDLLVSRRTSPPELFSNPYNSGAPQSIPQFTLRDPQFWLPGVSLSSDYRGMAVADVDNDGDQEPVLAHFSDTRLLRNDGTQPGQLLYSDDTARFGSSGAHQQATCAAWSDFDRDGQIDLFLGRIGSNVPPHDPPEPTCQTAPQFIFVNRGDHFEPLPLGVDGGSATSCYAATWGDVDTDGDSDLVMGASPGQLRVFSNEGFDPILDTDLLVDRTATMVVNRPGHDPLKIVALSWTDLEGQGGPDLVAGSIDCDGLHIYSGSASALHAIDPTEIGLNPLVGPVTALTGFDFDLNGWQDVFVGRAGWLPPLVMAEGLIEARSVEVSDFLDLGETAAPVVIAADFDNEDGDPDLYLGRHLAPSANDRHFYFRNQRPDGSDHLPTDPKWVKITLAGTTSNVLAIGARVIVDPGTGHPMEQTVDGSSGRGGQRPATLDFWVGGYQGPTIPVTVVWPNGHRQSAIGIGANRPTYDRC